MKKFILTLLILITPYLVNAQVSKKTDMKGKIGISLYGGVNIPVSGDYSSTVKATDILKVGSQFGIGLSYFITKGLGVEGTLNAGYNHYKDKYKPEGNEPMWVNFSSSVNVIYNFGHLLRNPVISPFARAGVGTYSWEHFEDGLIGSTITKNNKNHNVNSFGFNIGAGAEYSVTKKFTVGVLLDYVVYHPKYEEQTANENTSVSGRTVHGFLNPQVKLSYYIPTR